MMRHCDHHLREAQEALDTFKNIEQMLNREFPEKQFWLKTVQNGLAHVELEIAWLKQLKQGS